MAVILKSVKLKKIAKREKACRENFLVGRPVLHTAGEMNAINEFNCSVCRSSSRIEKRLWDAPSSMRRGEMNEIRYHSFSELDGP